MIGRIYNTLQSIHECKGYYSVVGGKHKQLSGKSETFKNSFQIVTSLAQNTLYLWAINHQDRY